MSLLNSLLSVSSLTFISRILGLFRDMVIASTFRTGIVTDAFFVAFKLPNLLRRFFAEGAFTQAFVPVFNEIRNNDGEEKAKQLTNEMAGLLAVTLLAISLVGVVAAPVIIVTIVPGFADVPNKQELTASLLRIMMPYILFMSLAALCSGILNSYSRFKIPAFTPCLLNISMIGATLFATPYMEQPIIALAWGVFVGGALQLGIQALALKRLGKLPIPRRPRTGGKSPINRVLKLVGQGSLGVSVVQISLALNMVFASFLIEGSVTWLYYADRLMELPAGLLGAAIAVIILPSLSRSLEDGERFTDVTDWAMRITLVLAVPATVSLFALAVPIISTIFEHGEFRPEDTVQTGKALKAYCIGIVGFIFVKVLASALFALQDMVTPVKIAVAVLVATQTMNAMFVLALDMEHVGLALSIGIAACLNAMLLAISLRSKGIDFLRPGWERLVLKVAFAAALLAVTLFTFSPDHVYWSSASPFERVYLLCGLVVAGGSLYFLALALMGIRMRHFRIKEVGISQASQVR